MWPDKSNYEGEYKEGKKNGKGRYVFADGSIYDGEWHANLISGKGKYTWPDGRSYEGDWLRNMMHGTPFHCFYLFQNRYRERDLPMERRKEVRGGVLHGQETGLWSLHVG